jgi:hypothetical protein
MSVDGTSDLGAIASCAYVRPKAGSLEVIVKGALDLCWTWSAIA